MISKVVAWPRYMKRLTMLLADFILLPFALWTAVGLRMDVWEFPGPFAWWMYILPPILGIPIFIRAGMYRAILRYFEERALVVTASAVTLTIFLFAGVVSLSNQPRMPLGALVIYWLLAVVYLLSSRFFARAMLRHFIGRSRNRCNVAIYGAGSAGIQLAQALRAGREFNPVVFIDDNPKLNGMTVSGVPVCSLDRFQAEFLRFQVAQILLAIPSASRNRRVQIINELEPLALEVKVMPGMDDLIDGSVLFSQVREVEIDELLGRENVPPINDLLHINIAGKVVMVTGAGGSIGSELCRQILRQLPSCLLLYEISEFMLYSIEQELCQQVSSCGLSIEIIPVLGSVQNSDRLQAIMQRFKVQTVYHAAAYKHVPLVEFNLTEGVLNNTFGTLASGQAAIAAGVETFVLISTDKAVRPTNIMGASKRMAELVLQALAAQSVATRFSMVRFGNVLGSSGSVVPLFRRQIAAGGPVTVTHPEIIRYFMTIPEASQLVIQAGAMAKGGEVYVLDMGKPVKILDLARRMIHLSGYSIRDENNPDGDIEIQFTGLRPGEKLYEELLIGGAVAGTPHPRIMKAQESFLLYPELAQHLRRLRTGCDLVDCSVVLEVFSECVQGFQPERELRDHLATIPSDQEVRFNTVAERGEI